jgi:hypothetical protein
MRVITTHRAEELVAHFDGMLDMSQEQRDGQPSPTRGAPSSAVAGLSGTLRSLCLLLGKLRAPLRNLKLVSSAFPNLSKRWGSQLLTVSL